MSLPPGFLDELRIRTSLSQVAGRKVSWDLKKSNQGKGDMWAPCPFHQEKTASFHVDDRKGYYYCFGCHQKGDAISFVRETENVSFIEAIEILAREAGMQMPAQDPKAREKADRREILIEATEAAVKFFRMQLKSSAGTAARDYLNRRGLTDAAIDHWQIGFAPPGWETLREHLAGKGIDPEVMRDAGLVRSSDSGRAPYDAFRNRIMFPIRDVRGRAIAFGGRAMDPEDKAKYLNSSETAIFDKGRTLFNHGPARQACAKGQPLIVAEGYLDVIALSQAGFPATVAPLGTAITEEQLQMLWRMDPEPILALDGDRAGLSAAMRAMDLALPLIEAGQSLRFCLMPQGQDPDDLIRSGGRTAMERRLSDSIPMVALLWRRATEGKVLDSPERRAALDRDLRESILRIKDRSIRSHYGAEVNRLRNELFRAPRTPGNSGTSWRKSSQSKPTSATRSSPLVSEPDRSPDDIREAVILATLVTHPELVPEVEMELELFEPKRADGGRIVAALLSGRARDRSDLERFVGREALEILFSLRHVQIAPGVRHADDPALALACVQEELAKLAAFRGVARETEDAAHDIEGEPDEGMTWRLAKAAEARNRAVRSEHEDETEYQTAPNGVRIAAEERSAFEDALSLADPAKSGRKSRSN